ncbi:MAG: YcxB family protein [Phycisphaerae bacterium]
MEIVLNFTLTLEEYQNYQLEHLKARKSSPYLKPAKAKTIWQLPPSILIWFALSWISIPLLCFFSDPIWSPLLGYFVGISVIVLFHLFRKSYLRAESKKQWQTDLEVKEPRTVTITNEFVAIELAAKYTRCQWEYFKHFHESPTLLLLYIAKNQAFIIPKRVFASPDDLELFRQLCQARPRNAATPSAFPVQPIKVPPIQTISQ